MKIFATVEAEGIAKGIKLRIYNWILLLFDARRVNLMLAYIQRIIIYAQNFGTISSSKKFKFIGLCHKSSVGLRLSQ